MQTDSNPETTTMANVPLVRDLPLSELRGRAVGLTRRLGQQFHFNAAAWQTHWDDLVQTALLAFLGCHDRPLSHAYTCAHTDLKNYAWVHIRGLNGGWKSLAAREYRLLDGLDEMDETLLAVSQSDHEREHAPRPVEWAVEMREAGGPPTAAALFRHILIILVGLNSANWYPERMYRAALILALRATGHVGGCADGRWRPALGASARTWCAASTMATARSTWPPTPPYIHWRKPSSNCVASCACVGLRR